MVYSIVIIAGCGVYYGVVIAGIETKTIVIIAGCGVYYGVVIAGIEINPSSRPIGHVTILDCDVRVLRRISVNINPISRCAIAIYIMVLAI
jgi:hypothetical protein